MQDISFKSMLKFFFNKKESMASFLPVSPIGDFKCGICLEEQKKQVVSDNCKHFFHARCIKQWADRNPICPLCRRHIKSITFFPPFERSRSSLIIESIHDIWHLVSQRIEKGANVFLYSLISGTVSPLVGIKIGTTLNETFQPLKDCAGDILLPVAVAAIYGLATIFFAQKQRVFQLIKRSHMFLLALQNISIIYQLGVSYLGIGLGASVGIMAAYFSSKKIEKLFMR